MVDERSGWLHPSRDKNQGKSTAGYKVVQQTNQTIRSSCVTFLLRDLADTLEMCTVR